MQKLVWWYAEINKGPRDANESYHQAIILFLILFPIIAHFDLETLQLGVVNASSTHPWKKS